MHAGTADEVYIVVDLPPTAMPVPGAEICIEVRLQPEGISVLAAASKMSWPRRCCLMDAFGLVYRGDASHRQIRHANLLTAGEDESGKKTLPNFCGAVTYLPRLNPSTVGCRAWTRWHPDCSWQTAPG